MKKKLKPELEAPPDNFVRKLRAPGGMERDAAIAGAREAVESQRTRLSAELQRQVALLQQDSSSTELTSGRASQLRTAAAIVYNLAGTYGYVRLQDVAANLLDVLAAMRERAVLCTAPVDVHAHAALLFAPGAEHMPDDGALKMLKQLRAVANHLRQPHPCTAQQCAQCPARDKHADLPGNDAAIDLPPLVPVS